MACCAFAVFLLSQLLAPFRALAVALGWTRAQQPDAAVLWTPGSPSRRAASGLARRGRIVVAVLAVDLALLLLFRSTGVLTLAPGIATPGTDAARLELLIHQSICGQPARSI